MPTEAPAAQPLADFDYRLPPERIAQSPAVPRDASRMMVMAGAAGLCHARFIDLPQWLSPGDLLVVNRTRVIPARVRARRATGGAVELLFCSPVDGSHAEATQWRALARPANRLRPGTTLTTAGGTALDVVGRDDAAVLLAGEAPLMAMLQREGQVPLPPYLQRAGAADAQDAHDYQTLFAREPGAVAAPTASLHFTETVIAALRARGVQMAELVLHVGPGTFLPVRPEHAQDVRHHVMHKEHYALPAQTQAQIRATRRAGGRVVAVGTTALRAMETWAHTGAAQGDSQLFITPGYSFRSVDALVTNFHLPKSTLLMLVSAMAGRARVLGAYAEAIARGYRFFSYGDAMLIIDAVPQ